MLVCVRVCVRERVCVCVREKERDEIKERERDDDIMHIIRKLRTKGE